MLSLIPSYVPIEMSVGLSPYVPQPTHRAYMILLIEWVIILLIEWVMILLIELTVSIFRNLSRLCNIMWDIIYYVHVKIIRSGFEGFSKCLMERKHQWIQATRIECMNKLKNEWSIIDKPDVSWRIKDIINGWTDD